MLTLEKMKDASGDILYVTRSAFLVQNARELYYANGWSNDVERPERRGQFEAAVLVDYSLCGLIVVWTNRCVDQYGSDR